jgi:hypothetical protein
LQNGLNYGDLGTLGLVDNHSRVYKKAMKRDTPISQLHKPEAEIMSKLKKRNRETYSQWSGILVFKTWTFFISASSL